MKTAENTASLSQQDVSFFRGEIVAESVALLLVMPRILLTAIIFLGGVAGLDHVEECLQVRLFAAGWGGGGVSLCEPRAVGRPSHLEFS